MIYLKGVSFNGKRGCVKSLAWAGGAKVISFTSVNMFPARAPFKGGHLRFKFRHHPL